jgi:hypothetical protein
MNPTTPVICPAMRLFQSESGDWYKIPVDQYLLDVTAYREAVARADEPTMLKYEEGRTGWRRTQI